MSRSPILSVVLPSYRTAWALPELCRRLRQVLTREEIEFEIVVVDDASPDHVGGVAAALAPREPCLRSVVLPSHLGQHRALLAGFASTRGRWVLAMDADLQDPPEAIPALLALAGGGADVVFAARVGRYQSTFRMLGSWLYRFVRRLLVALPAPVSAFVLLDGELARRLATIDDPQPSVPVLAALEARQIELVPVTRQRRPHGRSAFSHWARLRTGVAAIRFAQRHRRRLRASAEGIDPTTTAG